MALKSNLYVHFTAVESREIPATKDRAAMSFIQQKAYLVQPPTDDAPFELRTPFSVGIESADKPYDPKKKYTFSFEHFTIGKFGRLEFNSYAEFDEMADEPAKMLKTV